MKYIGIDIASNRIHSVFLNENGEIIALRKWTTKEKNSEEKLYDLMSKFENDVKSELFDFSCVAIEKAIYIQNFKTSSDILQIITGVHLTLHNIGIKNIFLVGNTTWKKGIGIGGNANKEKIKKWAIEKFGLEETLDQDFFDASGIAWWLRCQFLKKEENENTK